ncbi:hypothetical protein ABZY05_20310 [Streptomyces canus]|uniref:hypothetical protein n=1 Tax=Streptomyces canus TaxID=58343 RepID=UPI0033A05205
MARTPSRTRTSSTRSIAPVPAAQVEGDVYAALGPARTQVVDRVPDRDAGKSADQREVYPVLGDVHTLAGPLKRDPVLRARQILVQELGRGAEQAELTYDPVNPDTAMFGALLILLTGSVLLAGVAFALVGAVTPAI